MKDEMASRIIKELVALRSKMYNGHFDKKGCRERVIKTEIKFQDYKDCRKNEEVIFKS